MKPLLRVSCLAVLFAAVGTRAATPAWLYPAVGPCGEAIDESLAPPPGATAQAVLLANISRTYVCPDDKKYTVEVEYFTPEGELAGTLELTSSDSDRPIKFLDADGAEIGTMTLDQASEYAVTVDSGTADWTRRAVKEATGAAQDVAYVVRGDTDGPANPGCSGVQDGETVVGEYQAVYTFYGCME